MKINTHGMLPEKYDTGVLYRMFLKIDDAIGKATATLPAGSDTEIQYNDSGAFGADAAFRWDKSSHILDLGVASGGDATGNATIESQDGSGNANGGDLTILAGLGAGSGNGGTLSLQASRGGATGIGGTAELVAGSGGSTSGVGGEARLLAGPGGPDSAGGRGLLNAGDGQGTGNGGNAVLRPGLGGASGKTGHVVLNGLGVALATNATGGFTMLPTCAGTPTGTPHDIPTGTVPMVFDTTGVKLWFYTGGAWKMALFV